MKKHYIFIPAISLIIFLLYYACDKEVTGPDDFKKDFIAAALVHTEAMEVCLDAIRSSDIMNASDLMKLIEVTSLDFITENAFFGDNQLPLAQKMLLERAGHLVSYRKMVTDPVYKGDYGPYDYLTYTIMEFADDLSEEQMELLLTINNIMESYETAEEIIELLTEIQDINSQALEEEDRWVIYAATTIGMESVSYWNESLNEWMEAIMEHFPDKSLKTKEGGGWFNWGNVSNSDIAGAIAGSITGAMVGALAGGVGAGPGAASGAGVGGIGASAHDAVTQVLIHLQDGGGGSGDGDGDNGGNDEGSGGN